MQDTLAIKTVVYTISATWKILMECVIIIEMLILTCKIPLWDLDVQEHIWPSNDCNTNQVSKIKNKSAEY